ncbi:GL21638 [Drosophila persimilis]|uniref:GL21638 n=1 Tax=Drosophila persimilis TaxID=7234 RepID=B4GFD7_DROPE|nr:uncharacterized protein CG1161 [Drosophila persimilis]EDW34322.1 GL21638 [Drosophila persimilis]
MAHKRLFIYAVLLAICYLVGVTWAESASQTLPVGGGSSSNNASQGGALPPAGAAAIAGAGVAAGAASGPAPKQTVVTPAPTAAAPPKAIITPAPGHSSSNASSTANPATECVCAGALLPRLDANGKELPICAECKCSHVARNTTLIKVVVIIVIWIISILVIYMLFLMCLDPLLNKRVKANYQEHTNEDDEPTPPMPAATNQELSARANVLNRVGHQQDKWKRQVREQRRHIYDRHTMLN